MHKTNCLHARPQHFRDGPDVQHLVVLPVSGCCNAQTRKGTPCRNKNIYRNGRCKLHGGLSTGPKTKKGKAASRRNGMKGGRPRLNRQKAAADTLKNPTP